ncbi:hypothetical protein BESB_047600 [Besnoitia besnoiti]|uniref:Uncharacterized protein n=1 Tax=Besnoitia besnoiti TaxID=94643 RepID=A0A2A9MDI8_BESBE|nr:hypothetical protein BESB_047600 [Besnoitia besnoiti]PFH36568.1 hypothetical protein BESB_047600 [Besnoitia besnoiti]
MALVHPDAAAAGSTVCQRGAVSDRPQSPERLQPLPHACKSSVPRAASKADSRLSLQQRACDAEEDRGAVTKEPASRESESTGESFEEPHHIDVSWYSSPSHQPHFSEPRASHLGGESAVQPPAICLTMPPPRSSCPSRSSEAWLSYVPAESFVRQGSPSMCLLPASGDGEGVSAAVRVSAGGGGAPCTSRGSDSRGWDSPFSTALPEEKGVAEQMSVGTSVSSSHLAAEQGEATTMSPWGLSGGSSQTRGLPDDRGDTLTPGWVAELAAEAGHASLATRSAAVVVHKQEEELESPWAHIARESNRPFAPVTGHYVEGFTSSSSGSSTSVSPSPLHRSPARRRARDLVPGGLIFGEDLSVSGSPSRRRGRRRWGEEERGVADEATSVSSSSVEGDAEEFDTGLFGMAAGRQFMQLSRALLGGTRQRQSDGSSNLHSEDEAERIRQHCQLQEMRIRALAVGAGRASPRRRAPSGGGDGGEVPRSHDRLAGSKERGGDLLLEEGEGEDSYGGEQSDEERLHAASVAATCSSSAPGGEGGSLYVGGKGMSTRAGAGEAREFAEDFRRGRSVARRSPRRTGRRANRERRKHLKQLASGGAQSSLAGLRLLTDGTLLAALLFGEDERMTMKEFNSDDNDTTSWPERSHASALGAAAEPERKGHLGTATTRRSGQQRLAPSRGPDHVSRQNSGHGEGGSCSEGVAREGQLRSSSSPSHGRGSSTERRRRSERAGGRDSAGTCVHQDAPRLLRQGEPACLRSGSDDCRPDSQVRGAEARRGAEDSWRGGQQAFSSSEESSSFNEVAPEVTRGPATGAQAVRGGRRRRRQQPNKPVSGSATASARESTMFMAFFDPFTRPEGAPRASTSGSPSSNIRSSQTVTSVSTDRSGAEGEFELEPARRSDQGLGSPQKTKRDARLHADDGIRQTASRRDGAETFSPDGGQVGNGEQAPGGMGCDDLPSSHPVAGGCKATQRKPDNLRERADFCRGAGAVSELGAGQPSAAAYRRIAEDEDDEGHSFLSHRPSLSGATTCSSSKRRPSDGFEGMLTHLSRRSSPSSELQNDGAAGFQSPPTFTGKDSDRGAPFASATTQDERSSLEPTRNSPQWQVEHLDGGSRNGERRLGGKRAEKGGSAGVSADTPDTNEASRTPVGFWRTRREPQHHSLCREAGMDVGGGAGVPASWRREKCETGEAFVANREEPEGQREGESCDCYPPAKQGGGGGNVQKDSDKKTTEGVSEEGSFYSLKALTAFFNASGPNSSTPLFPAEEEVVEPMRVNSHAGHDGGGWELDECGDLQKGIQSKVTRVDADDPIDGEASAATTFWSSLSSMYDSWGFSGAS